MVGCKGSIGWKRGQARKPDTSAPAPLASLAGDPTRYGSGSPSRWNTSPATTITNFDAGVASISNANAPSVLEQYSCFVPIDASAAKMIRAYLALWRATGEPELLAKARTLGDTITRVQTPEGRIPTFWTHDTLGQPLYDWLNCMGSSAGALMELDDALASPAP